MARLVIRNRDKINLDDPRLNAFCMKRGMVVDILPDGKSLGTTGETYSGWTVIEVPGVSPEDLREFLKQGATQRRKFVFDLDAYEAGGAGIITALRAQQLRKQKD